MHPVIARFLDLGQLIATIEKAQQAVSLDADEAAIMAELGQASGLKEQLLKAKGRTQTPRPLQQRAIVVAVRAATQRLLTDEGLGAPSRAAMAALEAEGASTDEAQALVAQVLLDEAFGYAEDPTHFDRDYVKETLATLLSLAKVNADQVDDWLEAFARAEGPTKQALRMTVGEALLDAAWNDGPSPIAPEHLDDALEHLEQTVASADRLQAFEAMKGFIAFLVGKSIIGQERAGRLSTLVDAAAAGPSESPEEETDEDEDEVDANTDEEEAE